MWSVFQVQPFSRLTAVDVSKITLTDDQRKSIEVHVIDFNEARKRIAENLGQADASTISTGSILDFPTQPSPPISASKIVTLPHQPAPAETPTDPIRSIPAPVINEALSVVTCPDPVTLERLIESAQATTYTEVYAAFRHRKQVDGDRLFDCLLLAETLEQAMDKLIAIAGFGPKEAVMLGLDKFDVGELDDLCAKLKELTGDTYEISPFEQPPEPQEDRE